MKNEHPLCMCIQIALHISLWVLEQAPVGPTVHTAIDAPVMRGHLLYARPLLCHLSAGAAELAVLMPRQLRAPRYDTSLL